MTITINGKKHLCLVSTFSYEEIVELANRKGYPTVTYRAPKKGDVQRQGEMHPGCADVKLEDGMVFNVQNT